MNETWKRAMELLQRADMDAMSSERTLRVGPKQWADLKELAGWGHKWDMSPHGVVILGCKIVVEQDLDGVILTALPPPTPRPARTYA